MVGFNGNAKSASADLAQSVLELLKNRCHGMPGATKDDDRDGNSWQVGNS